jgi:tRNA-splicing ligase RtcB
MSEIMSGLKKLDDCRWMVPQTGGMKVPGIIYSSESLIREMGADESPKQVANVAHLPGIVKYSLAMPDMHWGYGFPIGGVAAFDLNNGIISPGGVGYDINCGCRLVTTRLLYDDIRDSMKELIHALFKDIPTGVGSKGVLKLSAKEEKKVLIEGAKWAVNIRGIVVTYNNKSICKGEPYGNSEEPIWKKIDCFGMDSIIYYMHFSAPSLRPICCG